MLNNLVRAARPIHSKALYLLLFAVFSAIYYAIISYLIAYQNRGIEFLVMPIYLIYLEAIAGGFLLSVSVFYLLNYKKAYGAGVSMSAGSAALTSIVGGCGCSAPIAFGLFSFALGGSSAIYAIDFMSAYAPYIVGAVAISEITVGIFYLSKIGNPNCRLK